MAVTSPTFFRNLTFSMPANRNDAFYELMQWLNDDHATETGPGWVLIAADDTTRIDTAATFTALDSGNDWSKGNANIPPNGSWCVLQTLPGRTARVQHILCFFGEEGASPEANSDRITFTGMPYADGADADPFVVPGATTAASFPTVPTISFTSRTWTEDPEWSGTIVMSACADESSLVFLPSIDSADPIPRRTFWVAGELDNGPVGEDRNFAYHMYEGVTNPGPHIENSANYLGFQRVSARSGTTAILTNGYWSRLGSHSGSFLCANDVAGPLDALGRPPVLPLALYFVDQNRAQQAGIFRLLREITPTIGKKGTLAGDTWLYVNDKTDQPGMAMAWDGVTAFP